MKTIFKLNDKKKLYENGFSLKYPPLDFITLSTYRRIFYLLIYF